MEPMTWIALAGLAMNLLGGMGGEGDKKKGSGQIGQLPQVAPFNPQPMNTGDSRDTMPDALRGAEWLGTQPEFGGEAMAQALRGGRNNDFSIYG